MASIKEIKNLLAELQENIENRVQSEAAKLQDNISSLRKDVNTLQKEVNSLSNRVESLEEKVGVTFELSVKDTIRRRFGDQYAEEFRVKDLYGLTRLAFPKELQKFDDNEWQDTTGIHERRTDYLANWLYSQKTQLKQRATLTLDSLPKENRNSYQENIYKLCRDALNYLEKQRTEEIANKKKRNGLDENRRFLCHYPELGIMLMSCFVLSDEYLSKHQITPFFRELQIDCRGTTKIVDNIIIIEIGEIKSTLDSKKAILHAAEQLCIRLAFIGWSAFAVVEEKKCEKDYRIQLIGRIFLPSKSKCKLKEKMERIYTTITSRC